MSWRTAPHGIEERKMEIASWLVVGPLIGGATAPAGGFGPLSLFIALIGAAGFLIVTSMICNRFAA